MAYWLAPYLFSNFLWKPLGDPLHIYKMWVVLFSPQLCRCILENEEKRLSKALAGTYDKTVCAPQWDSG